MDTSEILPSISNISTEKQWLHYDGFIGVLVHDENLETRRNFPAQDFLYCRNLWLLNFRNQSVSSGYVIRLALQGDLAKNVTVSEKSPRPNCPIILRVKHARKIVDKGQMGYIEPDLTESSVEVLSDSDADYQKLSCIFTTGGCHSDWKYLSNMPPWEYLRNRPSTDVAYRGSFYAVVNILWIDQNQLYQDKCCQVCWRKLDVVEKEKPMLEEEITLDSGSIVTQAGDTKLIKEAEEAHQIAGSSEIADENNDFRELNSHTSSIAAHIKSSSQMAACDVTTEEGFYLDSSQSSKEPANCGSADVIPESPDLIADSTEDCIALRSPQPSKLTFFHCKYCRCDRNEFVNRYRLFMIIGDFTANAYATLFDECVQSLFGMDLDQLWSMRPKDNTNPTQEFLDLFRHLEKKRYVVRVKVNRRYGDAAGAMKRLTVESIRPVDQQLYARFLTHKLQ